MAELLHRMKCGDRTAAAEFLLDNAAQIRRRFKGKLGPDVRRLFDSQDLLSTVSRRLDAIIFKRALAATSVGELWSLIGKLASHSIAEHTDKALRHREFDWSPEALDSLHSASTDGQPAGLSGGPHEVRGLEGYLDLLDRDTDRSILRLRALGRTHAEIASELGIKPATVRKRWQRIRRTLRTRLPRPDSARSA